MDTKLIIVEGIPGSGKTSTASFVRDCVENRGEKPILYLENAAYHPVDVDNLSFVNDTHYSQLLSEFSQYKSVIERFTERAQNGHFLHYLRWHEFCDGDRPRDLFERFMSHNVHDTSPPDQYYALLKERWEKFSTLNANGNEVVILECCLYQNPFTVFTGKHNYDVTKVQSMVFTLAQTVKNLNPALIYLRGDNVKDTLQRVVATRPQEWIDLVAAYINGQGYGKAHHLQGLDGVISFYELLQAQMDEMTARLDWQKLTINNTTWEWDKYHQDIAHFIEGIL